MRDETKSILLLMYTHGPYMLITSQALCAVIGISLLLYSVKMLYWYRDRSKTVLSKCAIKSAAPLLH